MFTLSLIVLARAIHLMAGVIWAGSTFLLAAAILPMATRYAAEGGGRWASIIARRVGPISGISALFTVLSGIYLFAQLHPQDSTISGLILKAGALAGLLSLATGFLVGRPAGLKLAMLNAQSTSATALSAELLQRMTGLRRRTALSSRLSAALLGVAVLSMAVFRYAPAFA